MHCELSFNLLATFRMQKETLTMKRIDLAGTWTLVRANTGETIKAQVPGDNFSALLAARRIPDPFHADNEQSLQWIGREDWIYRRNFRVDNDLLKEASVVLNCDGLDTIATIRINGQRVGTTRNMFARHRFEVKPFLKTGPNSIEIELASPVKAAEKENRHLPYPIPCVNFPESTPHRNLIRKVQCHSGWDWGPSLLVSGIPGAIHLDATSTGRTEYVATTQHHRRNRVDLDVDVDVHAVSACTTALQVTIAGQQRRKPVTLKPGINHLHISLPVHNPKRWWPCGYGAQPLYDLTVTVAGDSIRKRIGFRTLEVINREDKAGLSLTFRVNGTDIFCKGANWIPADALPQRQTRAVLDNLLTSAVGAHMNMLRVWGGGQYESDDFYDLCDEKGILLWHDFMFSCALYPATPVFLEQVRQEAGHQVRRLRDHACLALWCGNNEDVGALRWFQESRDNRDRYLVDYDRLNEGVLGKAVDTFDPTHLFWPSSPCGGRGDYSDCWHDDKRGDMHFWSVWHEGKSLDAYLTVKPRFCSEFGYQSFPSLSTIRTYAPPDQWNVTAPIMEYHQRNARGNSLITEMFTRYFRMPEGFANFVYLSQVQQAMAIKTGVDYWRTLRPHCMGTLYWQLNDLWPVCSWSSLEYGGKWKLLHYEARRFYAPCTVSIIQKQDMIEVWVVNDRPQPVRGNVEISVLQFDGKRLNRRRIPVSLKGAGATCICRKPVHDLLPAPEQAFLHAHLRCGKDQAEQVHVAVPWKSCNLSEPELKASVKALPDGRFAITLSSRKPAFFVYLDTDPAMGHFEDNGFHLLAGQRRTVQFHPSRRISKAQFIKALSVHHLRGTYA